MFESLCGCFGLLVGVVVVVAGRPSMMEEGGAAAAPLWRHAGSISRCNGDSADQRACAVDDDESLCSAGMGLARKL
jgi:hypothetical protein